MFSRHPAPFGAPPSEVVFDGIEPGAPVAQLLYHQHQAEIGRFQGKARQNREISEQPTAHMQQAMADGGHMRYSYNNGLETLHVRLTPRQLAEAVEQPVEATTCTPRMLAVDFIIAAKTGVETLDQVRADDVITQRSVYQFTSTFVTGIILDPDGATPVTAKAGGAFNAYDDARRLVPACAATPELNARTALARREVAYPAGSSGGFARPPIEAAQGIATVGYLLRLPQGYAEGSSLIFDLYMVGLNTYIQTYTSDIDTSPTLFGYESAMTYNVQLREYRAGPPVVADVPISWGRRDLVEELPVVGGSIVISDETTYDGGHTGVWSFIVDPGYADTGSGTPSDPALPGMGDRLGGIDDGEFFGKQFMSTVNLRAPEERVTYTAARWAGPVSSMTRIARVQWSPACQGSGSVKIEVFDTGQPHREVPVDVEELDGGGGVDPGGS